MSACCTKYMALNRPVWSVACVVFDNKGNLRQSTPDPSEEELLNYIFCCSCVVPVICLL